MTNSPVYDLHENMIINYILMQKEEGGKTLGINMSLKIWFYVLK